MKKITIPLLCLFSAVLLRTAWVSDDAYITLRTVYNFVNGYGLRWNILDRVQSYTHPLWMFCLSLFYWLLPDFYFATLALCFLTSLVAVWLLLRFLAVGIWGTLLAGLVLMISRSFIDYSTSGLENPLTNLLLIGFLILYYRQSLSGFSNSRDLGILALMAGLGLFNRLDNSLIFAPAMAYAFWSSCRTNGHYSFNWSGLRSCALGFTPLILWELFSLFYYGFPFPNTAYAKLNTGINSSELLLQGACYYLHSLNDDPITLVCITTATVLAIANWRQNRADLFVALGIVLYLTYIARIGGDFMSGRFFSTPLLAAVVLLTHRKQPLSLNIFAVAIILLSGIANDFAVIRSDRDFKEKSIENNVGIADERSFYYKGLGLLKMTRSLENWPTFPWAAEGRKLLTSRQDQQIVRGAGMTPCYAGPQLHGIDIFGICDPLLARLPPITANWRIGHFVRDVPQSYYASAMGPNVIKDPDLAAYWDKLSLITRGPLFSWARLQEIFRFNFGLNNYLLENYLTRTKGTRDNYNPSCPIEIFSLIVGPTAGMDANTPGCQPIGPEGLAIYFPSYLLTGPDYEICLNGGQSYELIYYRSQQYEVGRQKIDLSGEPPGKLVLHKGKIPPEFAQALFDTVVVSGRGNCKLSYFSPNLLPVSVNANHLQRTKTNGDHVLALGNWMFHGRNLLVECDSINHAAHLEISLNAADRYSIAYLHSGRVVATSFVHAVDLGEDLRDLSNRKLAVRQLIVPSAASAQGFDTLLIEPFEKFDYHAIGHLKLSSK